MTTGDAKYPHFKWAFSTLGCPELSLDDICKLARDFGLKYFELRAVEQRLDLPILFAEQFGSRNALGTYFKEQGVEVCCLDTSLKLVGNNSKDRETFLEFLPWAEAIGTPYLRVFDGGSVEDGLDDDTYAQAMETIHWWRQEKEKNGWKTDIAIETHDCMVHKAAHQRITANYADLKFIWDTHHTWRKSDDAIEASWRQLGAQTINVHIKDSISKPSENHPYTYVNFGEGEFPLSVTLDLLRDHHYQGYVTLEWERMWHPYLDDFRQALARVNELNWF